MHGTMFDGEPRFFAETREFRRACIATLLIAPLAAIVLPNLVGGTH